IRDVDRRQPGQSTENWLNGIMREMAKTRGANLMH
ncbi:response regulator, partial [Mesorhizobium sp. M7A.F.Ca.US.006.04.2.1]